MRSFLKVGLVAMVVLATVSACDRKGTRDQHKEFDADAYVEEEFRDFFEVEEKAGAAHQLPEQLTLPSAV